LGGDGASVDCKAQDIMTDDGRTIELMPTTGVSKRWTSMRACGRIPPTAVGGLFRCRLQTKAFWLLPRIHPRQWWIVQVQPTDEGFLLLPRIPHHGSGWIVQVQPTDEGFLLLSRIPPTAVGGIVQVLPTPTAGNRLNRMHRMELERDDGDCRQHLKRSPTAVGGISGSNRAKLQ